MAGSQALLTAMLASACVCAQDLESLIRSSGGLSPEFGADGLLRLVEFGKIPGAKHRIEAVERAYRLAEGAFRPYALLPAPLGFTDGYAAIVGRAGSTRVDRLSLQSRAVRQMASLDPAKSLAMLKAIVLPDLTQRDCEVGVVADVRYFYDTVGMLAENAKLPKPARGDARESLIASEIHRVSSAAQVFAMAKTLGTSKLPADIMDRLTLAFAAAMRAVDDGDRAFSVEMFYEAQRHGMSAMLYRCAEGTGSCRALLSAVSTFYGKHLRGVRCQDTFAQNEHHRFRDEGLAELNQRLLSADMKDAVVAEPAGEDLKLTAGHKVRDFWDINSDYRRLMTQIQMLGQFPSKAEEMLRPTLTDIEKWDKPTGMSAREFFLMKSEIFGGLATAVASTPREAMVLGSYVSFLNLSEGQRQEYPGEWLWRILNLFQGPQRMRDQSAQLKSWGSQIASEMERSSNAVISFYAQLQRIGALQ